MARKAKPPPKITARDILDLLLYRHAEDVCIPECKTGPTWFTRGEGRLDLWAMKKSWAHPMAVGYEIKVSRRDFVSDDKWPNYLPFCNCLYFVTPPNLIQPDEVSPDVGLIVCSSNCSRLYTKKKAPYREVQVPEELYRYVLMNRVNITRDQYVYDERQYWRSWLQRKEEDRQLGRAVSKSIQKTIAGRITKVEQRNHELEELLKAEAESIELLKQADLWPPHKWTTRAHIRDQLEAMDPGLPKRFEHELNSLTRTIERIKNELKSGDPDEGDQDVSD